MHLTRLGSWAWRTSPTAGPAPPSAAEAPGCRPVIAGFTPAPRCGMCPTASVAAGTVQLHLLASLSGRPPQPPHLQVLPPACG